MKRALGRACITVVALVVLLIPQLAYLQVSHSQGLPVAAGASVEPQREDPYFPGLGNAGYDVLHYDLRIEATPSDRFLAGKAVITARATSEVRSVAFDFVGLVASKVTLDGSLARASQTPEKLLVEFDRTVAAGTRFTIAVTYEGIPTTGTAANTTLENGLLWLPDVVVAFNEPDGARRWFPANDVPSDKATFEFQVTTPIELVGVANGELVDTTQNDAAGTTTYSWDAPAPMATYLAIIAIGNFQLTKPVEANGVTIRHAIATTALPDARNLSTLPAMLAYFERRFGAFPFEQYGVIVVDAPITFAFESQTFTLSGPADDRSMAHELAHQWFGDSVTPHRWRDIWLAEGFATYGAWLWADHANDTPMQESVATATDQIIERPVAADTRDPGLDMMFSSATYDRAALFLHALRTRLGDKHFFQLLRDYSTKFAGRNATTKDFRSLAEHYAGKPLQKVFDDWLADSALPQTQR